MKSKRIGIIYILIAAVSFAFMNLFVRLAGDVPVMQKCFFRNIVASLASFIMILRSGRGFHIEKGNFVYLFLRALTGTLGIFGNFYAISYINISDASMLNKLSPFFAIIFSGLMLKEKANRVEWGALVIAFIGALFVVKPQFSMDTIPALAGLIGGMGAGFAYTCVRKLGMRGEKGPMIIFFFSLFSCIVTLPAVTFFYSPMSGQQLMYLLLAGVAATGGQLGITAAYTHAPAKEISVYDYSQVIFAALLGMFFLGQFPDRLSIIGYIIIISVALLKYRYDIKRQNELKRE